MTKYARIIRGQIISYETRAQLAMDEIKHIDGKPMLREVTDTRPTAGPDEVLVGPVVTILPTTVTRTWTKRAKTGTEKDAEKNSVVNRISRLELAIALDVENRLRVLEGKQPVTLAQYRTRLRAYVQA